VTKPRPLPDTHFDEPLLVRIRTLLAKAEATPFEAEAHAFTAKAHQLMARHSISRALLDETDDEPIVTALTIDAPYASAKVALLAGVAESNRCKVVWSSHNSSASIVGFAHDIDAVELLYTSLLLQSAIMLQLAGPVRDSSGRSRTKAYRRSFILGFAKRITERLRESLDQTSEAIADETGTDLLPILATKDAQIDDKVRSEFGNLGPHRPKLSSAEGYLSGLRQGDRADLNNDPRVDVSRQGSLTS